MSLPRALFVSLRPHQWTKNLVVLAPLAFSKHLFDGEPVLRAAAALAVFCGLSGAVYLVNDLADVERDRLHPLKRLRPLASGALGAPTARLFAASIASARVNRCTAFATVLYSSPSSAMPIWRSVRPLR